MIGNVLFFKKTTSFVSKVIANMTKSEFTHVALIVAYDEMTNVATIIESDRFVSTRMTHIQLDETHVVYTAENMTEEMRERVVKFALQSIGTKYDYFQIFGLFLSLIFKGDRHVIFNSSNKMICSELIDLAYYRAGIHRSNTDNIGNITPQELIEAYKLRDVRKGL